MKPGSLFCAEMRSGLFIGLSLSELGTRNTCNAGDVAVMPRLKEPPHRILASIDGPCDNVIVVKPPMCFSKENADLLVDAILEIIPTITRRTWRTPSHIHLRQTDRQKRNEKFVYHRVPRCGTVI